MKFSVRTGAFSKECWNHDAQRTITTSSVIAISMIVIFIVDVFGQIPSTGNSILSNAVAFENGAVLLDYSDEYGSRASVNWIALGLVDSSSEIGWSSKKLAPFPHDFTFELATNYILQTLAFDTSNTEESRQCVFTGRVKKWQRRIEVRFKCPNDIAGAIYFPRNKKWFNRDYLDKNNNTYTVRIKGSDCN